MSHVTPLPGTAVEIQQSQPNSAHRVLRRGVVIHSAMTWVVAYFPGSPEEPASPGDPDSIRVLALADITSYRPLDDCDPEWVLRTWDRLEQAGVGFLQAPLAVKIWELTAVVARYKLDEPSGHRPWFPPCPDCGRPLRLRVDTKYVYCLNKRCKFDGIEAGEVVGDTGQPGPGLPRRVIKGRRVPWVTPVIGGRPAWLALNSSRVDQAARRWLCQYCGEDLGSAATAWVATVQGAVAAGGAMHRNCMHAARGECPVLRKNRDYVYVEVVRSDQKDDWSVLYERVCAYEAEHGALSDTLPLPV